MSGNIDIYRHARDCEVKHYSRQPESMAFSQAASGCGGKQEVFVSDAAREPHRGSCRNRLSIPQQRTCRCRMTSVQGAKRTPRAHRRIKRKGDQNA
jgi:hypothetical protein